MTGEDGDGAAAAAGWLAAAAGSAGSAAGWVSSHADFLVGHRLLAAAWVSSQVDFMEILLAVPYGRPRILVPVRQNSYRILLTTEV